MTEHKPDKPQKLISDIRRRPRSLRSGRSTRQAAARNPYPSTEQTSTKAGHKR